jgi:hypothetical protein
MSSFYTNKLQFLALAFITGMLLTLTSCNRTEDINNTNTDNGDSFTVVQGNEHISLIADGKLTERTLPVRYNYGYAVSQYQGEIVLKWHDLFAELDRYAGGYRPTPSPRALGYMNLAAYESVLPGLPLYQSLARNIYRVNVPNTTIGQLYHWPAALNGVYYTMCKAFFPHVSNELKAKIEQLYATNMDGFKSSASLATIVRSQAHGVAVANAIYEWSATDAVGHNAYLTPQPTTYNRPIGPFLWQPAPPLYGTAAFPYWGKARTFAITEREKLAIPPSQYVGELSNVVGSPYYNQLKEVYDRTNNAKNGTSQGIFKDDKWIAEFWSDDNGVETMSPACRLVSIANQLCRKDRLNLQRTVLLYAKMGIALSDASVAIWHSKYTYNIERPITGIRRNLDKTWISGLNNSVTGVKGYTPPFPGYPSGHSGFGAAGASVLAATFGEVYTFTDNTHLGRTEFLGMPRTFTSFKQMAQEDAISRIPLGVHVRMDCEEGVRLGNAVANKILSLPWKRFGNTRSDIE